MPVSIFFLPPFPMQEANNLIQNFQNISCRSSNNRLRCIGEINLSKAQNHILSLYKPMHAQCNTHQHRNPQTNKQRKSSSSRLVVTSKKEAMKKVSLSLFVLLSLLLFIAHVSEAAITCGEVNMKAASCVTFASGKIAAPPQACCTGLQQLVQKATTVTDRRAICQCLKNGVKNIPGVQDRFLGQIPGSCKIKVGFPVSLNTNCNSIN